MRETERRAKAGTPARAVKVVAHPDQEAALLNAEEALEEAFGHGVRVRTTRRGLRAELSFANLDELLEFARGIARD